MNIERAVQATPFRHRERGGIVILVALMLLVLLSIAAFGLSRTVIREMGISGNVSQAGRAEAVADAGLDWFMAWENDAQKGNTPPASADQAKKLVEAINSTYATGISLADNSSKLVWNANVSSKDGMVLQGTNDDGSASQAFNLRLLCLGKDDGAQPGSGETTRGNPSGGTNVRTNIEQLYAWEAISTGQALLPGDAWRFQAARAAKVVIRPKQ